MEQITRASDADLERAKRAAFPIWSIFTFASLVAAVNGWVLQWGDMTLVAFWGIFGTGSALAAFLVVRSVLVGQGWTDGATRTFLPEPPPDFVDVLPTPPTRELSAPALPALPAYDDDIRVTHFSGAVANVARKTIHGFEPKDLEWLCVYLANGGKWTEAAMEKLPLPYSKEMMGKAAEGTKYTAFMDVCTAAQIIVGREGKKSGTLAVLEAGEMLTRIKALPELAP